jgi:hypothetical protein
MLPPGSFYPARPSASGLKLRLQIISITCKTAKIRAQERDS